VFEDDEQRLMSEYLLHMNNEMKQTDEDRRQWNPCSKTLNTGQIIHNHYCYVTGSQTPHLLIGRGRRQVFLYTMQQHGDMEGRWMNKAVMELKLTRNTILLVEIVKELNGQFCSQHCIFCYYEEGPSRRKKTQEPEAK